MISCSKAQDLTGYLHHSYAESFLEYGIPRLLPRSSGWVLLRDIPDYPYRDAMGCYPLFTCFDWSQLHSDLEDLPSDLICLSVVTDPFGVYDVPYLQRCFKHVVFGFHAVILQAVLDEPIAGSGTSLFCCGQPPENTRDDVLICPK